ncbi:hypothetical protein SLE2022_089130 [Rubroshorea leprosula]
MNLRAEEIQLKQHQLSKTTWMPSHLLRVSQPEITTFFDVIRKIQSSKLETLNPCFRYCHFETKVGFDSLNPTPVLAQKTAQNNVAIFWDLDNKPPNTFPPYEAAFKLKLAASSFGVVRYMVAYANSHAFSYGPQVVREQRREKKIVESIGE